MRNLLLALSLAISLCIPFAMVVYHASHQGDEWHIQIRGFDPRDLLRGRYIEFRYDFGSNAKVGQTCLSGEWTHPRLVNAQDPSCIDVVYLDHHIIHEPQRFYIPESLAYDADHLVRSNADQIRVGISVRHGRIILKNMYYNQIPITEYLKKASYYE